MLPGPANYVSDNMTVPEMGAWEFTRSADGRLEAISVSAYGGLMSYLNMRDGGSSSGDRGSCFTATLPNLFDASKEPIVRVSQEAFNSGRNGTAGNPRQQLSVVRVFPAGGANFPFPKAASYDPFQLTSISSFYVLLSMILLPRIVDIIVLEKVENVYYYLRVTGMSLASYWLGHFLFYFSYLVAVNVMIAVFMGLASWFALQIDFALLLVAILLWCASIVTLGFVLGAVIDKRTVGSIVSYLISIVWAIMAVIFLALPSIEGVFWIPSVAFIRIVSHILRKEEATTELVLNFVFLAVDAVVFGVVAFGLLEARVYQEAFAQRLAFRKHTATPQLPGIKHLPRTVKSAENLVGKLDSDVAEVGLAILEQLEEVNSRSAIVMDRLSKSYDGGRSLVLNSLCFNILKHECFALLGQNGSGKTTLLSILMGLRESTGGQVYFNGQKQSRGMCFDLGVCPQFDALVSEE